MPLPSQLTYNDLSGDEIIHILEERFSTLLRNVPYLQKHITLPRVRMTLNVKLEMYADQPTPETQFIADKVDIVSNPSDPPEPNVEEEFEEVIDASPSVKGKPPDQIRDEAGLVIPTPTRGAVSIYDTQPIPRDLMTDSANRGLTPRDVLSDRVVDSPGRGLIDRRQGVTIVEQDIGPAGLARGEMNRNEVQRGGRDGDAVESPKKDWRK